jgi:hypothetical protein
MRPQAGQGRGRAHADLNGTPNPAPSRARSRHCQPASEWQLEGGCWQLDSEGAVLRGPDPRGTVSYGSTCHWQPPVARIAAPAGRCGHQRHIVPLAVARAVAVTLVPTSAPG